MNCNLKSSQWSNKLKNKSRQHFFKSQNMQNSQVEFSIFQIKRHPQWLMSSLQINIKKIKEWSQQLVTELKRLPHQPLYKRNKKMLSKNQQPKLSQQILIYNKKVSKPAISIHLIKREMMFSLSNRSFNCKLKINRVKLIPLI